MRIQMKPRWSEQDTELRSSRPPEPVSRGFKQLALLGIVLFWLFFLGWLGEGGQAGMEMGFMLFGLCQLPMLWRWMRNQLNRWR